MNRTFLFIIILFIPYSVSAQDMNTDKVKWYDIEEAVSLSLENPRKIIVYVYSDNCSWCTRMERNTFSHPVIAEYLNSKYYPVKLSASTRKDINLGARTYKFIPANPSERTPAYHELVVTLLNGRLAYPAYALINERIGYMGVEMGYKSPENMEIWLHFIAEDVYLDNRSFEEYSASFRGKLKKAE